MHTHTRRAFWGIAGGVLSQAMLRAAQARAQAANYSIPALFDIEKVAEGVYAAIARPAVYINCNAAIFEGASDILVVDTHSNMTAAVSLVSQIRRSITTKPVRYIVNTHFHGDHVQGTPTYKRIAPSADVVACETTRRRLAADDGKGVQRAVEQAQKNLQSHKQKLAEAKTGAEKAYWSKMRDETAAFAAEMKRYTPELPNVTFETDLRIRDKAHDLHLAFRGRGHTDGDIIVYCPQKKVLAAGDLLHSFSPTITDGYPREWPKTLDKLAEFEFQAAIGGHGSVHKDRSRLGDMRAYLAELAEVVDNAKREGKTLEQAQAAITPASLKSLAGGYGRFFAGQRLKGSLQPPGKTEEDVLNEAVKTNVTHVYANLDRS